MPTIAKVPEIQTPIYSIKTVNLLTITAKRYINWILVMCATNYSRKMHSFRRRVCSN